MSCPTGTATFDTATPTSITFSLERGSPTTIETLSFNAPGYTFELLDPRESLLLLSPALASKPSANAPTFNVDLSGARIHKLEHGWPRRFSTPSIQVP